MKISTHKRLAVLVVLLLLPACSSPGLPISDGKLDPDRQVAWNTCQENVNRSKQVYGGQVISLLPACVFDPRGTHYSLAEGLSDLTPESSLKIVAP